LTSDEGHTSPASNINIAHCFAIIKGYPLVCAYLTDTYDLWLINK